MKPLVSVVCITYNHEKYIADAIESFIMQETNFPFEIIIHDDASTDRTADIIRENEEKYPKIIKPIYQTENQYSKKVSIASNFVIPRIKGKYVATCEGDDFWIDTKKLQKQVDFLEHNKEYIACFHSVKIVDTGKNFTGRHLGLFGNGSKEITIKDAARGGIIHCSSRLILSYYYKAKRPEWMRHARHGDYALALFLSAEGRVYYIDEVMSSYRIGVENSLMSKFREYYTIQNDIEYNENRIETLNLADEYYNFKYHDEIQSVNLLSEVKISLLKNDFSKHARERYKMLIRDRGVIRFIKTLLLNKMPRLARFLVNIKGKKEVFKNKELYL